MILPRLQMPTPDALPLSRVGFSAVGIVGGGANGINIAEQIIAAGAAVKSGVIDGTGFNHLELVSNVAGSSPNNADLAFAIVLCDPSGVELTEVTIGQMPGTSGIGQIRGEFPGLGHFKVKLFGVDGATYLHEIRWLKLSKQ